jgi:hypothetical protein
MFEVEEPGRGDDGDDSDDSDDEAGASQEGSRSRRWFTYYEGCAPIRIITCHDCKLRDAVYAQLVARHRAE